MKKSHPLSSKITTVCVFICELNWNGGNLPVIFVLETSRGIRGWAVRNLAGIIGDQIHIMCFLFLFVQGRNNCLDRFSAPISEGRMSVYPCV